MFERIELRDKLLIWIENWLSEIKQRVGINGSFSGCFALTSGASLGLVPLPKKIYN